MRDSGHEDLDRVQRDDSDKHEVTLSDPIPVENRP